MEGGLDFSYVARDCGSFRETKTGSVRWQKSLLAMLFVLSSMEKLTVSQGRPHPWESLSTNWMALTGAGWRHCLDGIKAEPDDICIFEHLRGSACHHMALLITSLQDWAFSQMHV